ncbi:MAG: tRNA uridine-5-carboxymethylaminomethyl(34) synthesis GTPase MnmE [Pseudomonadota bacterium]
MDTIYALATARGKAGVAVLRVSGPAAFAACAALCGDVPMARQASVRRVIWDGVVLDEALVLAFAPGASFTGEAVVEFQVHGSQAVVAAVLRALAAQPGLRMAEPGEFTRRALENGRIDLTQVEGLADLIDAETEAQRRQAYRVLSGALGQRVEGWRTRVIRAAALLEATIDFADEDVPVDVMPEVGALIMGLLVDLRAELAGSGAAERLRDGYEVAILGAPNAGKSTLLNTLAGREAALTSDIAGTTRDVIEVRMDIAGLAVTFLDTAGLRKTADTLEQMGIDRAVARAKQADLRIYLLSEDADVREWLAPLPQDIVVRGKADLALGQAGVSGKTGVGVDALLASIGGTLGHLSAAASMMTRARHRQAGVAAIGALELAMDEVGTGRSEVAADHLRRATRALESLVGRVDVEMLLGEIFASFCIGK